MHVQKRRETQKETRIRRAIYIGRRGIRKGAEGEVGAVLEGI